MTTFNNLPLTEQLKALEPGDYVESNNGSRVKTDGWYNEAKGEILLNLSNDSTYLMHKRDVVRVVRPGEKREVPEIVGNIRRLMEKVDEAHPMDVGKRTSLLGAAILEIADHFEAEARKPEPPEARG